MKKIFAIAFSVWTSFVQAATLTPVQLLNPSGSAAGQAIVSTGASTAPGWANVTASGLTPIGANTVYGNFTGSSASPAAFAMPSCSSSGSALLYTSGTGVTCGSSFAMTTGATFTGAITPSQTLGIVGTTTNNNANAGSVGEYVTANASSVALTANVAANVTSISLTAGDWEVSGSVSFTPAGTTTISQVIGWISTTSASLPAQDFQYTNIQGPLSTGGKQSFVVPMQRVSVAATTTVYLSVASNFATSTMAAGGVIRARRVR